MATKCPDYRRAWHDGELAKKHYEDTSGSMDLRDALWAKIVKAGTGKYDTLLNAFCGGFSYYGNFGKYKTFR